MSKYKIMQYAGKEKGNTPVTDYDSMPKHHPDKEKEENRQYEKIHGNLEEVARQKNRVNIKKDFILSDEKGDRGVYTPSPVSGYASYSKNYGTIDIYDKPEGKDRTLLAKLQHIKPETQTFKNGDRVEYGQGLGLQYKTGDLAGKHKYPIHSHVETDEETYKKYISDIVSGNISLSKPSHTRQHQQNEKKEDRAKSKLPDSNSASLGNKHESKKLPAKGHEQKRNEKEQERIERIGKNKEIIKKQAKEANVPVKDFLTFADIETGGTYNEKAYNKKSGAKGLFQFVPSTAKAYKINGKEFDPTENTKAALKLYKFNLNALEKKKQKNNLAYLSGEQNPNGLDLYLAHQQGAGGYSIIQKTNAGLRSLGDKTRSNLIGNLPQKDKKKYAALNDQDLTKEYLKYWREDYKKRQDAIEKELPSGTNPNTEGKNEHLTEIKQEVDQKKPQADVDAARQVKVKQHADAEAAKQKAAEQAKAKQRADAEAAKQKAAEQAKAKQRADAEAAKQKAAEQAKAKQRADAEAAKQKAAEQTKAKQRADAEAAKQKAAEQAKAKQRADAEAAKQKAAEQTKAKQRADAEAGKQKEAEQVQSKIEAAGKKEPVHPKQQAAAKPAQKQLAQAKPAQPVSPGNLDAQLAQLASLISQLNTALAPLAKPIQITVDVQNGNIVAAVNAANSQQQRRS
ncbi:transglycosylase SLT domain-containing protein [Chromobacterium violaceum]|uniref:transglycosylase SLT domain-containing protein n=1 Tax=Chromobacterium violaceum TaxID=536 RepID=UPI001BE65B35|nr:transglycosylase SLT domain-containing protein [Chromobacterium violaceum]MBT2869553.1 transglycosylase SLT domain-containing protein [Chromobacterium violaceum]